MLHCVVEIDTDTYIQTHTHILNAFELSTINFPAFFLDTPHGMWDINFLTRD